MESKDAIIFIEGVDGCGKTELAKRLAQHYGLMYIDNGPFREGLTMFDSTAWTYIVGGINLQQTQFVHSGRGFVKTRYSLSERVYSEYFGRPSIMRPDIMELAALEKAVVILVDIRYPLWFQLWMQFRNREPMLEEREFELQRDLFDLSYAQCEMKKCRVNNDTDVDELVERAVYFLDPFFE